MDYYEENFWNTYKKELIDSVACLVENNQDIAAVKLILLGIDSLAGFYKGRTISGCVGNSFLDFIAKYMPKFDDISFDNRSGIKLVNRKTGKEITKPSEILYHIFRNDLIHDGSLGAGVDVYRNKDTTLLWEGSGMQIFMINILGFFEYYKKAINDYNNDISVNIDLKNKFSDKYNDITGFSFETR